MESLEEFTIPTLKRVFKAGEVLAASDGSNTVWTIIRGRHGSSPDPKQAGTIFIRGENGREFELSHKRFKQALKSFRSPTAAAAQAKRQETWAAKRKTERDAAWEAGKELTGCGEFQRWSESGKAGQFIAYFEKWSQKCQDMAEWKAYIWVPKSQLTQDGDSWLAPKWLVDAKIAEATHYPAGRTARISSAIDA